MLNKKVLFITTLYFLLPVVSSIIIVLFGLTMFWGILLYFALPSIILYYFGYLNVKDLFFGFMVGFVGIFVVDVASWLSGIWVTNSYILNFMVYENFTIDSMLWGISIVPMVVGTYNLVKEMLNINRVTYESQITIKKYNNYLLLLMSFVLVLFLIIYYFDKGLLNIPYFYLVWGLPLGILSIIYISLKGLIKPLLITTALLIVVSICFEYFGLMLNWWDWLDAKYLGWISLFDVSFPIDELLVWMGLFPFMVISMYIFYKYENKK